MKRVLISLLAMFPFAVFADCTVTLTEVITHADVKVYSATQTWHDSLTKDEAADMSKKGQSVMDVASKVADRKTGKYTVIFTEETACDGKQAQQTGSGEFRGVTAAGLNQIHRQALKAGSDLIKGSEDGVKKGKAKAWGKE